MTVITNKCNLLLYNSWISSIKEIHGASTVNAHHSVKASAARLRRAAAAGRIQIPTQDNDFLGLKAGDVLVWDDKANPVAGDLILVTPIESFGGQVRIRPAIFLAYQSTTEIDPRQKAARENGASADGSNGGDLVEIGNGRPRAGEVCIVEWTTRRRESYVDGKILGVVSHVIIPEVGIAALDLGLEVPDSAGPSFKVLIDSARLFGTLAKRNDFRLRTQDREDGRTVSKRV